MDETTNGVFHGIGWQNNSLYLGKFKLMAMRRPMLVLGFFLFSLGCKKTFEEPVVPTKPQMPTRTESGANVVAFKLNTIVHIYKGKPTYFHEDGVRFGKYQVGADLFIKVNADNSKEYKDNISMFIYTLEPEIGKEYSFYTSETSKHYGEYMIGENKNSIFTTRDNSGYIKFSRYDSIVAAGIFGFKAYSPEEKMVEITEGFFDISLAK
jgi:hypothetical protein